jgi:hypothetical protein
MPSKARKAFDANLEDVHRLLKIHADVGGDAKGRRYGLEVLNKSAMVLITAFWEAYCEDLAAEALQHLVTHTPSGAMLPSELKRKISAEIKGAAHDLKMWDLADNGWRAFANARLGTLMEERNRRLNTPKTAQIEDLFMTAIGLQKVSDAWRWRRTSSSQASKRLDRYIEMRGAIAHRGSHSGGVKKAHVTAFLSLVSRLAAKTGGSVNAHVKIATAKTLW